MSSSLSLDTNCKAWCNGLLRDFLFTQTSLSIYEHQVNSACHEKQSYLIVNWIVLIFAIFCMFFVGLDILKLAILLICLIWRDKLLFWLELRSLSEENALRWDFINDVQELIVTVAFIPVGLPSINILHHDSIKQ